MILFINNYKFKKLFEAIKGNLYSKNNQWIFFIPIQKTNNEVITYARI